MGAVPGRAVAPEDQTAHRRVYPEAYPGEATWTFSPDTGTFDMTLTAGPGRHTSRVVAPGTLDLTPTTHGAVLQRKADRVVWNVDGPGTFTLHLEPRTA